MGTCVEEIGFLGVDVLQYTSAFIKFCRIQGGDVTNTNFRECTFGTRQNIVIVLKPI